MLEQQMNHKKFKKTRHSSLLCIFFTCIFMISFCLAGCSAGKNKEIFDIEQLKNEDGTFQFVDIPFGSSYEEAANKLPLEFTKLEGVDDSPYAVYACKIDFYGEKAVFNLHFNDDRMEAASISFDCPDREKYEQISQKLIDRYGEAETVIKEEGNVIEEYKWEQEGTFMSVSLVKVYSELSCMVGVFTMDYT